MNSMRMWSGAQKNNHREKDEMRCDTMCTLRSEHDVPNVLYRSKKIAWIADDFAHEHDDFWILYRHQKDAMCATDRLQYSQPLEGTGGDSEANHDRPSANSPPTKTPEPAPLLKNIVLVTVFELERARRTGEAVKFAVIDGR
jgi:hypothetical protein